MDDSDGDVIFPVYVAQVLTPADPNNLKIGFEMMIDELIRKAEGDIVDWGTTEIESYRVLDPNTGQEMIAFQMFVRAIDGNLE